MQNEAIQNLIKSTEKMKEQQAKSKSVIMSVFSFASLVLLTLNGLHAIDIPYVFCLVPVGIEILLVLLGTLLLSIMVAAMVAIAAKISSLE